MVVYTVIPLNGRLHCAPLPDDWFMNVAFNYIKFASYSAIPFVLILTLNVAVIWRSMRVSPDLRRSFGGADLLTTHDERHPSVASGSQHFVTAFTRSSTSGSGSWRLPASSASASYHRNNALASITASQVRMYTYLWASVRTSI